MVIHTHNASTWEFALSSRLSLNYLVGPSKCVSRKRQEEGSQENSQYTQFCCKFSEGFSLGMSEDEGKGKRRGEWSMRRGVEGSSQKREGKYSCLLSCISTLCGQCSTILAFFNLNYPIKTLWKIKSILGVESLTYGFWGRVKNIYPIASVLDMLYCWAFLFYAVCSPRLCGHSVNAFTCLKIFLLVCSLCSFFSFVILSYPLLTYSSTLG